MFEGFDDQTVEFLWGIRFNNEKPWFEAHKQLYLDHVFTPMRELADEILGDLTDKFSDGGLICRVSRIYRDARRLHGRGPYKDHLWFSVEQPQEIWTQSPCFWFELGPESWSYGMGCYMAKPLTMAKLRARMDAGPEVMEALTRKLRRQSEFVLEGEEYKRPRGQAPSALLEPWYRKKSYSIGHEEPLNDALFSREIVNRLERGYDFLLPYYRYFATLDADADPRDA